VKVRIVCTIFDFFDVVDVCVGYLLLTFSEIYVLQFCITFLRKVMISGAVPWFT